MLKITSVLKLSVALFFLAILPAPVHALTPDQVFDKVKASVVVVKTLDAQGKMKGFGSGVLLPSGKIATNCHVVEGGTSYQAGRGKKLVSATLYAEDGDKDICLLDAEGIAGEPAQLGKATDLKVGLPVYAVGAPQGLELSLSDGIVSQLRGGPPPLIQTTAAISPGSSGGGLFDGEGRLVGLTTLYMKSGQSLNFATPVEWIDEVKPGRKTLIEGHSKIEWVKQTIALEELKDWQGMLNWCRKWTKSEPENSSAWYYLAMAYHLLNRYNDAVEAFRQALRIGPEDFAAWNNLGVTYEKLNRYDDAIDAHRQALRIDPGHAVAWYNLGVYYRNLKRYEDAKDAYFQALRIDPVYAEALSGLGHTYAELNTDSIAIILYRKALSINSDDSGTWNNLGNSYSALKHYSDAIDAYRQALRIDPGDAVAWYNLGIAYYDSGDRTAALEVVQTLRRLDPAPADKLFNLVVPR